MTTTKPTVHPKVAAAGLGGAVATIIIYVASIFGATIPGEVGAAIAALVSAAAGYLRPS